jgi:hypothetical protein
VMASLPVQMKTFRASSSQCPRFSIFFHYSRWFG